MAQQQWARLKADVNVKLRRGAWYRIMRLGAAEVVLDVNRQPLSVTRTLLQIEPVPPSRWSVVPSPRNAPRYPPSWGKRYVVCPACRARAQIEGQPHTLRCTRCNGLYEVAWNEPYLMSA